MGKWKKITKSITKAVSKPVNKIVQNVQKPLKNLGQNIQKPIKNISENVSAVGQNIGENVSGVTNKLGKNISRVGDKLGRNIGATGKFLSDPAVLGGGLGFALGGPLSGLVGAGLGGALGGSELGGGGGDGGGGDGGGGDGGGGGNKTLEQMAIDEELKRKALGLQQQGQINEFANMMEGEVANYRKRLAQNLADTSQQTFQQATPGLLEDLNARGLFTSQTARDQETNRALQELATQQNNILSDYDTQQFGNIQDLRGTALSALLGGDQSALDSALALRKAGIQRSFDVADQNAQNNLAMMLARRQSRDQLNSSLIGGAGMGLTALLCFDGETDIKMADGSTKKINEVSIGDTTAGGMVISRRESFTPNGTRYNHNGTIVTGSHAVFEDGIWKRIENSQNATPVEGSGIVYSLVTTGHRIYVGDNIYGDEFEVDDYYKHQERVNNETLQQLNSLVGSVA